MGRIFPGTAVAVILALVVCVSAACADEWPLPTTEVYYSQDRRVRLTVTPRELSSQLNYFSDLVHHRKSAGQQSDSTHTFARGVLQRRTRDGAWIVVWDRRLLNNVAPVSALVTDSGRYVVTFDNWFGNGVGNDVVVIYGRGGSVVRSMSLDDILPDYYVYALPRTVSSLWWGCKHRLDEPEGLLVLKVAIPTDPDEWPKQHCADLTMVLATGQPAPGTEWQNVLSEVRVVARKKRAEQDVWDAEFRAPLLAPKGAKELDWYLYLQEAFFRADPNWEEDYPETKVLRSPNASDYGPSEMYLRDALLQKDLPASVIMIASPASPDNLIAVLAKIVHEMKPGSLKNARIYVAVPHSYKDRALAALAPTGAKLIYLDPTRGIPQRGKRLKQHFGK